MQKIFFDGKLVFECQYLALFCISPSRTLHLHFYMINHLLISRQNVFFPDSY